MIILIFLLLGYIIRVYSVEFLEFKKRSIDTSMAIIFILNSFEKYSF